MCCWHPQLPSSVRGLVTTSNPPCKLSPANCSQNGVLGDPWSRSCERNNLFQEAAVALLVEGQVDTQQSGRVFINSCSCALNGTFVPAAAANRFVLAQGSLASRSKVFPGFVPYLGQDLCSWCSERPREMNDEKTGGQTPGRGGQTLGRAKRGEVFKNRPNKRVSSRQPCFRHMSLCKTS